MKFIGRLQDDVFLMQEDKIVIYGCGRVGKKIYEELKKQGMDSKVHAFCDKNNDLIGKNVEQIPILSVAEACQKLGEAAFLIASCCVQDMVETLQKNNINNIHITRI